MDCDIVFGIDNINGVSFIDDNRMIVGDDEFELIDGGLLVTKPPDVCALKELCVCKLKIYYDTLSFMRTQRTEPLYGRKLFKNLKFSCPSKDIGSIMCGLPRFISRKDDCNCGDVGITEEEDNVNVCEEENDGDVAYNYISEDVSDVLTRILVACDYYLNEKAPIHGIYSLKPSLYEHYYSSDNFSEGGIFFEKSVDFSLLREDNIPFIYLTRDKEDNLDNVITYLSDNGWYANCYKIFLDSTKWKRLEVKSVVLDHINPDSVYGYMNMEQKVFLQELDDNLYKVKKNNVNDDGGYYDVGLYDGRSLCDGGQFYLDIRDGKKYPIIRYQYIAGDIVCVRKGTIITGFPIINVHTVRGGVFIASECGIYNKVSVSCSSKIFLLVYNCERVDDIRNFNNRKFKWLSKLLVGGKSREVYSTVRNDLVKKNIAYSTYGAVCYNFPRGNYIKRNAKVTSRNNKWTNSKIKPSSARVVGNGFKGRRYRAIGRGKPVANEVANVT